MVDNNYILTCIEIAVHSRWWASFCYGNLPVELVNECPCKWCRERRGVLPVKKVVQSSHDRP